ncbi:MAG: DUF3870 domain-containing protein [Bacillota bacterium]
MGGSRDTLFFSGYAKLPAGITASELYKVVGVGLEVDQRGYILAAECTLATGVGRDFFIRMVKGLNLEEDFDAIVADIEERYHGSAQKAIITAMKIIREKFRAYHLKRRP